MTHIPEKFIVDSLEELNTLIDEQNIILSKAIVEGILENLDTDVPEVFLMSITVRSEKATYDITVKREDFAETLEENLPHYVREEEYEQCRRIADAIETLRQGTISKVVTNLKNKI
jgi:Cu/Ag efflux pump CusA